MKRSTIALAVAVLLLAIPAAGSAQADWTFEIPLRITNLTADIEQGAVMCVVGQGPIDGQDIANQVHTLGSGQQQAQPGEAPNMWDGIYIAGGDFVGYNTFSINAAGSGPASVTVQVVAPMTSDGIPISADLKISARYWACALAVEIQEEWWSVHVDTEPLAASFDFFNSRVAAEGTTFQTWYDGTIN